MLFDSNLSRSRRKVELVNIDTIIPYARNPRNNADAVDSVVSSIKEFGFKQPIVVDKENVIIVGHTRYTAAKRLDMKQVPVLKATDLDENKVKILFQRYCFCNFTWACSNFYDFYGHFFVNNEFQIQTEKITKLFQ